MIVHIVPAKYDKNSKNSRQRIIFNFHKDEDPYLKISEAEVERRHFLHAMIAREISSRVLIEQKK